MRARLGPAGEGVTPFMFCMFCHCTYGIGSSDSKPCLRKLRGSMLITLVYLPVIGDSASPSLYIVAICAVVQRVKHCKHTLQQPHRTQPVASLVHLTCECVSVCLFGLFCSAFVLFDYFVCAPVLFVVFRSVSFRSFCFVLFLFLFLFLLLFLFLFSAFGVGLLSFKSTVLLASSPVSRPVAWPGPRE